MAESRGNAFHEMRDPMIRSKARGRDDETCNGPMGDVLANSSSQALRNSPLLVIGHLVCADSMRRGGRAISHPECIRSGTATPVICPVKCQSLLFLESHNYILGLSPVPAAADQERLACSFCRSAMSCKPALRRRGFRFIPAAGCGRSGAANLSGSGRLRSLMHRTGRDQPSRSPAEVT